jgi:CheY-like chemotaxis protein
VAAAVEASLSVVVGYSHALRLSSRKGKEMILVVDDDPVAVRFVAAALIKGGYQVIVAQDGAAGLETFLADPWAIDLVLTDLMMPVLNGVEMAEQMRAVRPEARIVLMSAYPEALITTRNEPKYPLIRKTLLPEDLIRVVQANLNPPAAAAQHV